MNDTQINLRGLKIAYSDSEGLPVAYLFHKRILQRSLKNFLPDKGFSLYFDEQANTILSEQHQRGLEKGIRGSGETIRKEWLLLGEGREGGEHQGEAEAEEEEAGAGAGERGTDRWAQCKLSEDELEAAVKAKWKKLSREKRREYEQREQKSNNVSRRASYKLLAYREELLRWLVDLVRSPLPDAAIHWYSYSCRNTS